jgi:predicted neutral ceramidase superfamily lipid hydrolase
VIARNIPYFLANLSRTLWVGGTWALGYLAVPVLFKTLPDRQLAGLLAGQMFTWMAYVGIGCAIYLLAYQIHQFGRLVWKQKSFLLIVSMLILLLVGQFAIQPIMVDLKAQALPLDVMQSALASQFKALHGVSSILYLVQSLLGVVLVINPPRVETARTLRVSA